MTQDQYPQLYANFRWHVPAQFNMAWECCGKWAAEPAAANNTALIMEDESAPGKSTSYTFAQLQALANRVSNALMQGGVKRGDRVAIILPQRVETVALHMAIYQLGAVAMPLSVLFGPEALEFRLRDSAAVLAVADVSALANLMAVRNACADLRVVVSVAAPDTAGVIDWPNWVAHEPESFKPVVTAADEPALLVYTSGTTGNPKGALKPQRALIGNLTGFVASQNWFPQEGDVFWSPADWAWTGGLMDAMLPTLYFGKPLVGYRGRFDPLVAYGLMERHGVTNSFLFPTALKLMMKSEPNPKKKYKLRLRALMSAGEPVGETVFRWVQDKLGITVNEMFGQTEINYVVGNCAVRWPAKAGSIGRAYPGHRVAVIDDEGREVPDGEVGEIAVNRYDIHGQPDPVFFLGYWNNAQATAAKFTGDWGRTGDQAKRDKDGYFWYQGRADDMFKAAGYRIGPSEIENCLIQHPGVVNAAVIGKPDAERGNIVKAFVVAAPGFAVTSAAQKKLIADLQAHVRGRLAPYEYPKEIEFVDALPMTTTGKVQRRVLRQREVEKAAR
jgi:acetyl-CoA synthetase